MARGHAVKRLIWPAGVKEVQIDAQMGFGVVNRIVRLQIHLFVFDAFPEPLDENVVAPAVLAIHADPDFVILE